MTTDLDMATHALGHAPSGNKAAKKPSVKPMKAFHAEELHDGTYSVTKHHGMDENMMPVRPDEKGSAADIDGVHDHLHEHMGGTKTDEKITGNKKQGREEKAEVAKDKADPEKDATPEHGKTLEG